MRKTKFTLSIFIKSLNSFILLVLLVLHRFIVLYLLFNVLLIVISRCFANNVFQYSLGFWVDSLLEYTWDTSWLLIHVNWSVKWRTFELLQAWDLLLQLVLEGLSFLVDGVTSEIDVCEVFHGGAQVFHRFPVGDLIIVYPEFVQSVGARLKPLYFGDLIDGHIKDFELGQSLNTWDFLNFVLLEIKLL